MADTGWLNPGSVTSVGGGDRVWDTPEGAQTEDSTDYANIDIAPSETTNRLYASDFNTGSIVPGTADIDGIEVRTVRRSDDVADSGKSQDLMAVLADATGTATGDDKSDSSSWPDTDTEFIYGGPTDDWGLGPLTGADINDTDFGFILRAFESNGGTAGPRVDVIQMRVHYTEAASGLSIPVVMNQYRQRRG